MCAQIVVGDSEYEAVLECLEPRRWVAAWVDVYSGLSVLFYHYTWVAFRSGPASVGLVARLQRLVRRRRRQRDPDD